ncbi:MAG: hypothetical protein H7259_01340 [Cytophagales bacterium]|nr:hypothetical protein [Cytophaga sp.]
MANIKMCINFTKNITIMTTKLVYLIRLRSKHTSVKVGLSCQSEESHYTRSAEMTGETTKISDVLARLSNQLSVSNTGY